MITVTEDQLEALTEQRLWAFCTELLPRIRTRHGEVCDAWTDDELHAHLRREISFARENGFETRIGLESYADLAIAVGFGFGESETWAAKTLKGLGGEASKLKKLERDAVFAVRERE